MNLSFGFHNRQKSNEVHITRYQICGGIKYIMFAMKNTVNLEKH